MSKQCPSSAWAGIRKGNGPSWWATSPPMHASSSSLQELVWNFQEKKLNVEREPVGLRRNRSCAHSYRHDYRWVQAFFFQAECNDISLSPTLQTEVYLRTEEWGPAAGSEVRDPALLYQVSSPAPPAWWHHRTAPPTVWQVPEKPAHLLPMHVLPLPQTMPPSSPGGTAGTGCALGPFLARLQHS